MRTIFCVFLFSASSSPSMHRFLSILLWSVSAARYSDEVCERFRTTFNLEVNQVSFCNDDGFCEYLLVRCKEAFEALIRLQKRQVDTPPIVSRIGLTELQEMNANQERFEKGHMLKNTTGVMPELDSLAATVDSVNRRMLESFPHMVLDIQIDGNLLTQFVEQADRLAKELSLSYRATEIRSLTYQSLWFQKLTWKIFVMFDHIVVSGKPIQDIELLMIAFAPFVHAYMHASFLLELHHPKLLMSRTTWDIIHSLVKYHPIYTMEDGVWYLPVHPAWFLLSWVPTREPIPVDSADTEHALSIMDSIPDIRVNHTSSRIIVNWEPAMNHSQDERVYRDSVEQVHYAIRVMREHYGPSFVTINILNDERQSILQQPDQVSRLSIAAVDIINESVPVNILLNQVMWMTSSGAEVIRKRIRGVWILIRSSDYMKDSLDQIADTDVFFLQMQFNIRVDGQIVPLNEWIRHVLKNFFLYRVVQDDMGDSRSVLVAFGRIIALAILHRSGLDVLFQLISRQSALGDTPTIDETIFFNSHYIRSGFYDIYHEGMLESLFRNNGNRLIEALFAASIEAEL